MTDSANQNQSTDDQQRFREEVDGRRIAVLAGQGVEQVSQ